jgi:ABC-type amino acid transport substrate-binding protein
VGEIFLADDHYGIPVQKGDTATLNLINEGLAKIKENGTYDEIYAKWFE